MFEQNWTQGKSLPPSAKCDVKSIQHGMADADQEFKAHQTWSRNNVQQLQSAVNHAQSVAASAASGSPSTGGGNYSRQLDEHNAFEKFKRITGQEPVADVVEWFDRIMISVNSVIPGAHEILKLVSQRQTPIDWQFMQSLDAVARGRLDAELFSLFTQLFSGKAWTFLKAKNCTEGFEAFRYAYVNITKRTPQQLLAEHK